MPDGNDVSASLKIRLAAQTDAGQILRLVHEQYREKDLEEPFAADKVMTIIVRVIAAGQAFVLGDSASNRIVGTIGLDVQADHFTVVPHMIDLWTYVLPKHRSLPAFKLLIRAAEALAEERQVRPRLAIFGTKDLDRRAKLYQRSGYRPVAIMFEKE